MSATTSLATRALRALASRELKLTKACPSTITAANPPVTPMDSRDRRNDFINLMGELLAYANDKWSGPRVFARSSLPSWLFDGDGENLSLRKGSSCSASRTAAAPRVSTHHEGAVPCLRPPRRARPSNAV